MIVDISVACGAGNDCEPMPITSFRYNVVNPITSAETMTPMMRPICCELGVAPTRKPVLRSCDVAPAMAAAMHTTEPTQIAIGAYRSPVQPTATKIVQVRINVAMVIPEMGFAELPRWAGIPN